LLPEIQRRCGTQRYSCLDVAVDQSEPSYDSFLSRNIRDLEILGEEYPIISCQITQKPRFDWRAVSFPVPHPPPPTQSFRKPHLTQSMRTNRYVVHVVATTENVAPCPRACVPHAQVVRIVGQLPPPLLQPLHDADTINGAQRVLIKYWIVLICYSN
jgi:hypothetical protein